DGLVVGEPQEDAPDAGAAHREERREGFLAELGAGREPLLEDGPVDAVVDEVVDRGVPRHPCSSADYVYKNLLHCKQHCRIYTANAGRQEGPMTTLRRAAGWLALGLLVAALTGGGFAGRAHAQQEVLKIGVVGGVSGRAAYWVVVNHEGTEVHGQNSNTH